MALTAEQITQYLTEANGDGVMTPEAKDGDIMWWPQPESITKLAFSNCLKLVYEDNEWIAHSDQSSPV